MAGGAGSGIGTGGMLTKVLAAKRAHSGAHTVIASGRERDVLTRLAQGECIGSELQAALPVWSARKQWLADHLRLRGRVTLDDGAVQALLREGKSLLPIGVTAVDGEFGRGDVVACVDSEGRECARGLINYSAATPGASCANLIADRTHPGQHDRTRAHASGQSGRPVRPHPPARPRQQDVAPPRTANTGRSISSRRACCAGARPARPRVARYPARRRRCAAGNARAAGSGPAR